MITYVILQCKHYPAAATSLFVEELLFQIYEIYQVHCLSHDGCMAVLVSNQRYHLCDSNISQHLQ